MKWYERILAIICAALMTVLFSMPVFADVDVNMLENGGFEDGFNGWMLYLDDGSITLSDFEKHSGSKSVKLNGIEEGDKAFWNKIRQEVSVSPNTDYVLSGFVKITGAPMDTWKSKIEIEDASYTPFVTKRMHDLGVKPNGNWQEFKMEFNSGENESIYLSLCADNGGLKNVHYYDDLVLLPKDSNAGVKPQTKPSTVLVGENLIQNGSFENGQEGWEPTETWGTGSMACATLDTTEKIDGTTSLKITDCRWNANVRQFISVKPNTDYELTFYAKVTREQDEWSCLVKIAENEFTLDQIVGANLRKGPWKEWKLRFNSGDLDSVCLLILGNVSEFYVDNFSMYEIGKAEDIQDTTPVKEKPKTFADTLKGTKDENGKIRLVINDRLISTSQAPIIVNNVMMLPARPLFEAMGAKVGWNGQMQKLMVVKEDSVMIFYIGSSKVNVNGRDMELSVAPLLHNGCSMIPVSYVSDVLKWNVHWMNPERILVITSNN